MMRGVQYSLKYCALTPFRGVNNMSSLKWNIGDVEIYQLVELEAGDIIQEIIKNATPKNILEIDWLRPNFADDQGKLKALVQAFLIRSEDKNILIDTCIGNDKPRNDVPEWSNLQSNFLLNLNELGISETDVDIVACTHLHMDHVGWNTKYENNSWVPTFPKAKYLFSKDEYTYWQSKPENEIDDDHAAFDDSVTPILEAGLAELINDNHSIDKNVSFIPTPGHTPSHMSVKIESKGESAIISGDFLHHPCQIAHPDWSTDADTKPEQGIITRKRILEELVDKDTHLIGSHFASPVIGKVKKKNGRMYLKTQD